MTWFDEATSVPWGLPDDTARSGALTVVELVPRELLVDMLDALGLRERLNA